MTTICRMWGFLPLLPSFLIAFHHIEQCDGMVSARFNPKWYQRYDEYPPYCSTPDEMENRKVPPLQTVKERIGETRLKHVTAAIRHGARTPWSSKLKCWPDYWTNVETGIWDCDLTTMMAPPSPYHVLEEEGEKTLAWDPDNAEFLYNKIYDSLKYPEYGLTNELNGTCQVGQLLLQGYEQEISNGRILRDAYTHIVGKYDHDERMRLIELQDETDPWDPSILYYRSDDEQRTLMSGQVLLRGMFYEEIIAHLYDTGDYPSIQVHTADKSRDILDANEDVCPRLKEVRQAALDSVEYQTFNTSDEVQELRSFMADELGTSNPNELLDCLMTTMCTDRPLPDKLNDYGKGTSSYFQRLADFDIQSYTKVMKHDESAYAKLSMAPLWAEILENIKPWLDVNDWDVKAPKLALFSGHDTTLMPLLASLSPDLWGDTDWPAYASMLLIEIHESIDGLEDSQYFSKPFAFRLIFNGKVLTSSVPGCPDELELCDVTKLLDLVEPMASRDPPCFEAEEEPQLDEADDEVIVQAKTLMTTKEGMLIFLGLVIAGLLFGSISTTYVLTGHLPCCGGSAATRTSTASDGEDEAHILHENGFEDEPATGGSSFDNQ